MKGWWQWRKWGWKSEGINSADDVTCGVRVIFRKTNNPKGTWTHRTNGKTVAHGRMSALICQATSLYSRPEEGEVRKRRGKADKRGRGDIDQEWR